MLYHSNLGSRVIKKKKRYGFCRKWSCQPWGLGVGVLNRGTLEQVRNYDVPKVNRLVPHTQDVDLRIVRSLEEQVRGSAEIGRLNFGQKH